MIKNCRLEDFVKNGWVEITDYNKLPTNFLMQGFFAFKDYNSYIKYVVSRGHTYEQIVITVFSGNNYNTKSIIYRGRCKSLKELQKIEDLLGIS